MTSSHEKVPPRHPLPPRQQASLPCNEVTSFTCGECEFYAGPCTEKTKYLIHQPDCKWWTCHGNKREDGSYCTPGKQGSGLCRGCLFKKQLEYLKDIRLPPQIRDIEQRQEEIRKIADPESERTRWYKKEVAGLQFGLLIIEEDILQTSNYLKHARQLAGE